MAGTELSLSVKIEYIQDIFSYTLEVLKKKLLRNNLNFQESCKYKKTYVHFT